MKLWSISSFALSQKNIWLSFPCLIKRPTSSLSLNQWFWYDASATNRRLGITLFRYIWKARNMYIFLYHPIYPLQTLSKTINFIFYWNISHLYAGPGIRVPFTMDSWLLPPPGWIKLNFDGTFSSSTGRASIGGLVRDPYGSLIFAYSCEAQAAHPLEAELLALRSILLHLRHLPPSLVMIKGDCLVLISDIRTKSHLTWDMMPLWKKTMNLLTHFQHRTVQFCKRLANRVANLLAAHPNPNEAAVLATLPPHITEVFQMEKARARNHTFSFYHH